MGYETYYNPGDHAIICDRTGFKLKRSQCRKEWTGRIVRKESWEARNAQDFLRSKPDRQQVADPRTVQARTFLAVDEVKADEL